MSKAAAVLARLPELDTDDYQALVSAVLEGEHPRGLSTGEVQAFCSFCESALIEAAMVGLCLSGELKARWSSVDDDWVFAKR
jgi:hypothetical protein